MKNVVVQEIALPSQVNLEIEVNGLIEVRLLILLLIISYSSHDIASFLPQPQVFHLLIEEYAAKLDKVFLEAKLELEQVGVIENFSHR